MKSQGLEVWLAASLLLNLVGFAPFMSLLLERKSQPTPPESQRIQVRMIASQRQSPPVRSRPVAAEPQPAQPSPPQPRQPVAAQPQQPPPAANPQLPKPAIPQHSAAPSAPRSSRPVRSLSRPDSQAAPAPPPSEPGPVEPRSSNSGPGQPLSPPPPSGPSTESPQEPAPETPPPPVSSNPEPIAPPPPPPPPPPVSAGSNASQGVIPDKAASPKTNPPNAQTRLVLRKIGGKSFVRLQLRIYPDGHIEPEILVSSGNAELDQAVLTDLKDWRWEPAEVAGKPVLSEKPIRLKLETD